MFVLSRLRLKITYPLRKILKQSYPLETVDDFRHAIQMQLILLVAFRQL